MTIKIASLHPFVSRGFAAGLAVGVSHWRPGLGAGVRHSEIFTVADEAGGTGAALALALDQAEPEHGERPWLWVQDKAARRLGGRPYRPGIPSNLRHRLIHVAADTPEDALFALEEGLRCRDLAFVVGEIAGNPRELGFTASRRLSLAAEKHGIALWLIRLDAARDLGSARMRWEVRSAPSLRPHWNMAAPGSPSWRADLFRAHTHQPGQWILRDDASFTAEPAITPHPGDLADTARNRSLAPKRTSA